MERRSRRRTWLTILAVGNLLIWLTLATTVGLLASDTVDIGAESLFREFQATAGAVIEELPQQIIGPSSGQGSASLAGESTEAGDDVTGDSEAPAWNESGSDTSASDGVGTLDEGDARSPGGSLGAASQVTGADPGSQATSPTGPSASASSGTTGGLILLSDPNWQELSAMDSQLRASASGRPVQVRYSEAALNRRIAELLASNPEQPYHSMVIDLDRDSVTIAGDVTVLGFDVGAEVQGAVTAANCMPQVSIHSIKVAGLLTPGFVRDGVKDLIVDTLNQYPTNYPLCLEQLVFEDDRVTVYGSRR
jgi:hypothetical protein